MSKTLNSCSKVFERERKIKKARLDTSTHLADETTSSLQQSEALMEASSKSLQSFGKQMVQEVCIDLTFYFNLSDRLLQSSGFKSTIQKEISDAVSQVDAIEHYNKAIVGRSTSQAPATGATPQKRKWSYIGVWEKTKPRADLLQEHRLRQVSGSTSDLSHPSSSVEEMTEEPESEDDVNTEGADDGQKHEYDISDLRPLPTTHAENLLAAIDMDSEMPQASESSSNSDTADVPTLPPIEVELPLAQTRVKRRESNIPMPLKGQPIRPTLQEKSTNIAPDARARAARTLRTRR